MPVSYVCKRCGYITETLARFRRHCAKKKNCDPILQDIPLDFDKWQVEARITYYRVCPIPITNTLNSARVLAKSVAVCPFGQETWELMFKEEYGPMWEDCILSPADGVSKLIDVLHFNTRAPECHNVCFKDANTAMCFDGSRWVEHEKDKVLTMLVNKSTKAMNNYTIGRHGAWTTDEDKDRIEDFAEEVMDSNFMNAELVKELKRDVEIVVFMSQTVLGITQKALK